MVAKVAKTNTVDDTANYATTAPTTAVGQYLTSIARYPLLTSDEEITLAKRLKSSGDLDARERLITSNLRLVVSIAKKYTPHGVLSFMDYVAAGNGGLRKAVDSYDPGKLNPSTNAPYRFSTYASNWINAAIRKEIGDCGRTVRHPIHVVRQLYRYNNAVNALTTLLGRRPTDQEVLDKINQESASRRPLTRDDLANFKTWQQGAVSLDSSTLSGGRDGRDADNATTLDEVIADDETPSPEQVAEQADKERLKQRFVSDLGITDPRTEIIRRLRYAMGAPNDQVMAWSVTYGKSKSWPQPLTASDFQGEGMSLDEVGRRLHLSRERIRQIEKQAITKLRRRFEEAGY